MRHIGTLKEQTHARVFCDFLFAKGIPCQVEVDDQGAWDVWAKDEHRFGEAQQWLEKFRAHPKAPEFQTATADAAKARAAEAQSLTAFRKRVRGRHSIWPKFGGYGVGILTYALIAISAIIGIYTKLGQKDELLHYLFISNFPLGIGEGFLPEIFKHGEVWRLWTPIFVHLSLPHIIFNMLWLYNLGSMIEARQSWRMLFALVFGSALISNLAQYILVGPAFGGMSGVVYALVGYVWIRGKYDRSSGVFLDQTNLLLSLGWLVLCFTGMFGPIANTAHVAGLLVGMAWGGVTAYFAKPKAD